MRKQFWRLLFWRMHERLVGMLAVYFMRVPWAAGKRARSRMFYFEEMKQVWLRQVFRKGMLPEDEKRRGARRRPFSRYAAWFTMTISSNFSSQMVPQAAHSSRSLA
jgi:hypothetical protein